MFLLQQRPAKSCLQLRRQACELDAPSGRGTLVCYAGRIPVLLMIYQRAQRSKLNRGAAESTARTTCTARLRSTANRCVTFSAMEVFLVMLQGVTPELSRLEEKLKMHYQSLFSVNSAAFKRLISNFEKNGSATRLSCFSCQDVIWFQLCFLFFFKQKFSASDYTLCLPALQAILLAESSCHSGSNYLEAKANQQDVCLTSFSLAV